MTEYYRMPEMFVFDDFNKCMALNSNQKMPAYCIVNSYIKPDKSSSLYNFIHEFSKKDKQHFRHDKLQRGICIKDCLNLVQALGPEADSLYTKSFSMDSKLTLDFIKYQFVDEDRSRFNHILNICVNKQLSANYNLTGYSTIEYCLRRDERIPTGVFKN